MKTIIAIMSCTVMAFAASAFDNPNDKWAARRAIQASQHAGMADMNNTMGNMAMQAMIARMAQGGGFAMNQGGSPQVRIMQAVANMDPEDRPEACEKLWNFVKQLIAARNLDAANQAMQIILPTVKKYDPEQKQHAAEASAMLLVAAQGVMNGVGMPMGGGMIQMGGMGGGAPSFGGSGGNRICPSCHGSGTCRICHGTGVNRQYGQATPCERHCTVCGGSGRY